MERNLVIAYVALGVMALIPIYFGSVGAIKLKKKPSDKDDKEEEEEEEEEEENEFFSLDDAKLFPIFGSITLFSLYLLFTYFDKKYINYVLTAYFSLLGIGALSKMFMGILRGFTGLELKGDYRIGMWKKHKEILSYRFGVIHLIVLTTSILLSAEYAMTKHWIVSNLFGEAFSMTAIQLLNLDSFSTGIFLLSALFFYDIFWVFGTEVMVTVAKNFDAPIKLVWPKDIVGLFTEGLLAKPPTGTPFTMLGLGDIVIPGIYVCLCLQFDYHLYLKSAKGKKNPRTFRFPKPYFITCFLSYSLGLVTTVLVMHAFQAAQPALLYLSPACIFSSLFTALVRGELKQLWNYVPEGAEKKKEEELKKEKAKKAGELIEDDQSDTLKSDGLKKRKAKKST